MPPQTVSELVPDQLWVQCENPDCLKWRKVPGDVTAEELPDKVSAGFDTGVVMLIVVVERDCYLEEVDIDLYHLDHFYHGMEEECCLKS